MVVLLEFEVDHGADEGIEAAVAFVGLRGAVDGCLRIGMRASAAGDLSIKTLLPVFAAVWVVDLSMCALAGFAPTVVVRELGAPWRIALEVARMEDSVSFLLSFENDSSVLVTEHFLSRDDASLVERAADLGKGCF